jgi:hypothetical protein
MIKIKQGVPTVWRQRYKRYIWNLKQEAKDALENKRARFKDRVTGSYRDKRVRSVLYLFYYMNFAKFENKHQAYLDKLVTIEKFLQAELDECKATEGYEDVLPKGEDYRGFGTLDDIFGTLNYISDRHKCVIRLVWLLDLIKKYKHNELHALNLMDKGIK